MMIKGGHRMSFISSIIHNQTVMAIWLFLVFFSLSVVLAHMHDDNADISFSMKGLWFFLVLMTGPIGLGIYWFEGRKGDRFSKSHISL